MMTNNNKWTKTTDLLPPENTTVEVTLSSGAIIEMVRRKNLFYPGGGNMYAYYVPIYWRIKK